MRFSWRNSTASQRKTLAALALIQFFSFMSLSLPAPFFPVEAETRGISSTTTGWIFGVFSLTQFITSSPFGKLLSYVSCRFLCAAGIFLAGGCTVLFGLLEFFPAWDNSVLFVVGCFTLRIFLSLGCTAANTASFAIIANIFPDNIGEVFGLLETFTGLGLMLGPPIGGVLHQYLGFVGPFALVGTMMILFVPVMTYILPVQQASLVVQPTGVFRRLLGVVPAVITILSIIISGLIWSLLDPTLEPHLRQFNLSTSEIGLIFLLASTGYAVSSPIWGMVSDRIKDSTVLIIVGLLMSAAALLTLGPSPLIPGLRDYSSLWLNMTSLLVLGVSVSLALVPTFGKVLAAAEKAGLEENVQLYSIVAGLWGSAYALGEFLGPALGGMMVQRLGFPWTVTAVAGLCILMALSLVVMWFCEKHSTLCQPQYKIHTDQGVSRDGDQNSLHDRHLDSLPNNCGETHTNI